MASRKAKWRVVRFRENGPPITLRTGLTLEEAQDELLKRDRKRKDNHLARKHGRWFDSFETYT